MCLQSSAYFSAQRETSVNAGYYNSSAVRPLPLPPGPVSATPASVYSCTPSSYQIFRERCARCGDLAPGACLRELTHEPLTPQQNPIHTRIKIRDQHFE